MSKVEIVGHRRCLDDTLTVLQRRRVVQMLDATFAPGVTGDPLASDESDLHETEDLRLLRTRIDALLDLVSTPPEAASASEESEGIDLKDVRADLEEISPRVEAIVERIDELRGERDALPRHIGSLRRLLPLVGELPEFQTYETVALFLDRRHAATEPAGGRGPHRAAPRPGSPGREKPVAHEPRVF